MTTPLLLLGPGGDYRRAWPEEDETMKDENACVYPGCPNFLKLGDVGQLRASHKRLLEACKAGQAYMACLKRCWAKDVGRLIDSRGVVVAETGALDRLFDAWDAATEAAITKAEEVTG